MKALLGLVLIFASLTSLAGPTPSSVSRPLNLPPNATLFQTIPSSAAPETSIKPTQQPVPPQPVPDGPPPPTSAANAINPQAARGPAAPALIPLELSFGAIGTLHPMPNVTAEEAAWLSVMETRVLLAGFDKTSPDVLTFIKEHKLERHFVTPLGQPSFAAAQSNYSMALIIVSGLLAGLLGFLLFRHLQQRGPRAD